MKLKFPILFTALFFLFSCKNHPEKSSTNAIAIADEYLLDTQNPSYKIKIKEVDQPGQMGWRGSLLTDPNLGINAEYIPLANLIGILMGADKNSIILEGQDFHTKYYSVLIEQNTSGKENDSVIRDDVFKALNLIQENKKFKIDTVLISITKQPESIKSLNAPLLDALVINYRFTQDYVGFEDFNLEEKLIRAKYIDYRNLVLVIESPETCKIGLIENDWDKKNTKQGYEFEYVSNTKTVQIEKVSVRRNYLLKN